MVETSHAKLLVINPTPPPPADVADLGTLLVQACGLIDHHLTLDPAAPTVVDLQHEAIAMLTLGCRMLRRAGMQTAGALLVVADLLNHEMEEYAESD